MAQVAVAQSVAMASAHRNMVVKVPSLLQSAAMLTEETCYPKHESSGPIPMATVSVAKYFWGAKSLERVSGPRARMGIITTLHPKPETLGLRFRV